MSSDKFEIKMETKPSIDKTGLPPTVIHTGKMKQEPILQVSKIGMEELITDKKPEVTKIEIDSIMMHKLFDACAEDLMNERIINVPFRINQDGKEKLKFVTSYDSRNRIFQFSKDVKFFNDVFNLKNNDLADFLSSFFYSNLEIYSKNVFNAVPEIMPFTSVEALQNNRVQVTIH